MPQSLYSKCYNHPSFDATARCKQCAKPICDTCKVISPTGVFCSETCRDQNKAFTERMDQMDRNTPPPGRWAVRFKSLVSRLILLALGVFVIGVTLHALGFDIPYLSSAIAWVLDLIPGGAAETAP